MRALDTYAAALSATPQLVREEIGGLRSEWAEHRLWARAPSVQHLGELMAWFCLGELQRWPGHHGPTCHETRQAKLGPVLAHACRSGYITTGSQPGIDREADGYEQRAAVDGHATDAVLVQLHKLTTGTRLQVIAHSAAVRRRDYDSALDVTRVGEQYVTAFGARLLPRDVRSMFGAVPDHVVDELVAMWQVAIVDPQWGAHRLLWDRLAEPDWDHPAPPPEETAVLTPPSGFANSVDRKALIAEARAWVSDCAWREDPDEIADYSDEEIVRGVNRHYDGGIDQLARNALLEPVPPPGSPLAGIQARTHGWDGKPLTDADKRFFQLRDSGYRGWIDQDGYALTDAEHEHLLDQVRTSTSASTAKFDPPPAAKPHTPRSASTGGTTVNSTIQEIRGVLSAASDVIGSAQGPIQQAIDEAIRARNALVAAMDGSHQPDVEAQVVVLTNMIEHLEEALGRSHQAIAGNQQIGARL